ncbi:inheritance of peroxisomes protein 1-domain-containing protein [Xylaria telfairii]|nr:inheritance of peroxisomes protein 1-domain-containing protein [Xylaria telfairii]
MLPSARLPLALEDRDGLSNMEPGTPRPRRVMTAPAPAPSSSSSSSQQSTPSSSSPSRPAASASDDLVETLYSHPSVRIISFTTPNQRSFSTSLPNNNNVSPGSLPPSSHLERTIAVGAFRIYRAPGSVAFLSCGSALQPILPKSQCWCINEDNSRFVLQIRRPQYWRIEVPVADPDDVQRAVLLRDVFDKILLFEKTECPFERSFTVELPDPPETPVKKKAWTAEGKNLLSSPFSDLSPPAHVPTAISRGDRQSSISLDMSPLDLSSFFRPRARTESAGVDEAQDDVSSRVRDQSFRDALSFFLQAQLARVAEARQRGTYTLSTWNDRPNGASEQTVAHSPTWSENTAGDSTSPPLVPNFSPTSPEALQWLEANCTLAEIEELREKIRAYSIEAQYHETGATANSPDAVQRRGSLPDRKVNNVLEPIRSDGEDDSASFEGSGHVAPVNLARKRMTRMLTGRSFGSPPPLTLETSPAKLNEPATARKESQPPPSAADYPADHITTPKKTTSVFPSSSVSDNYGSAEPTPRPTPLTTDPRPQESADSEGGLGVSRMSTVEDQLRFQRRRSHASSLSISRRAFAPLPPAANFFTPPPRQTLRTSQTSQSRLAVVRRLPAVIIHKTMEILLGPPSYLVNLMLKVAAMIVAGEWRGLVFGLGEAGEQIPVQWDYYSDDEFSDLSDSNDYSPTTHSSNYSDSVPRTDVRRRTKWANRNDHGASEVD